MTHHEEEIARLIAADKLDQLEPAFAAYQVAAASDPVRAEAFVKSMLIEVKARRSHVVSEMVELAAARIYGTPSCEPPPHFDVTG